MFFRYLYAHSSRYFFTNRWFRLLIQLCLPINQNRGDSKRDDTQPNAANADKIMSQPRKRNAQMDTENRAEKKPSLFEQLFFVGNGILRQGIGDLPAVVGGKDAGGIIAVRTGEGVPLECHCEKDGVQTNNRIHALGEKAKNDNCKSGHCQRIRVQLFVVLFGQNNG